MKTKIIPFDLETAKKIQDGEIKGKIKTKDGQDVLIVLWNKKDDDGYVILALVDKPRTDLVASYTCNGEISKGHEEELDLVLEVPDNERQFKPFDKVLVRNGDNEAWNARLYDVWFAELGLHGTQDNKEWKQCVPYEVNQHLVGTTNKPKEE